MKTGWVFSAVGRPDLSRVFATKELALSVILNRFERHMTVDDHWSYVLMEVTLP